MTPLLDYAAIRARIPIQRVLELVPWEPTTRCGPQWRGSCPLISCATSHGTGRVPCFSVHVDRHLFRCFHCHCGGNQLDLWAAFVRLPLYPATLQLCHRLAIPLLFLTNPQPRNGG